MTTPDTAGTAPNSYRSPVNFRLPSAPWIATTPLQDTLTQIWQLFGQIVQALTSYCGISQQPSSRWSLLSGSSSTILAQNMGRYYDAAVENIAYGAPINVAAGGIQNANATNGTKPADGFCSTVGGIASGAVGEVILRAGVITGLSGLVKGSRYFLSTTGTFTTVKPVAAGNIEQYVGFAISTTELFFSSQYWIQH